MTFIHIKAGPFDSEARLEQESASNTCELFLSLLPYKQRIIHARWSGEGCWIPFGNTDLGLGFENATSYPAPGQFLLYPGGELAMMDLILVLLIAEAAAHAMGEYTSLADGVVMDAFDHILNWKLIQGSHPFPGKDGATCINEAAIVAAGFPYQAVRSVQDMPDCFSRPICALAMQLNDEATSVDERPLLATVHAWLAGVFEDATQK